VNTVIAKKKYKQITITEDQYKRLKRLFHECREDCDMCDKLRRCEIAYGVLSTLHDGVFYTKTGTVSWLKRELHCIFGIKEVELCL